MDVMNLAVISFDGVHLLLPQREVTTIEVVNNILDEGDTPGALGTLRSGGHEWPVFALSSDFVKQPECPSNYKFCVGIHYEKQALAFSIACEEVSTLKIENAGDLKSVQPCMRTSECPIESLVFKDDRFMLVSNSEAMRQFLIPEAAEL
jgi:hypothetical protein